MLPAEVGVRVQVPAATVPLQVAAPSLTVTLPVGVPPLDVTVNATAISWPVTDGFGVWVVIAVVVLAAFRAIGPEVAELSPEAPKLSV